MINVTRKRNGNIFIVVALQSGVINHKFTCYEEYKCWAVQNWGESRFSKIKVQVEK